MTASEAKSAATASPRSCRSSSCRRMSEDRMPRCRCVGSTPTRVTPATAASAPGTRIRKLYEPVGADDRAAVGCNEGAVVLDPGVQALANQAGWRPGVKRVLVHGTHREQVVFGGGADRVRAGHARIPTPATRQTPAPIRPDGP